MAGNSKLRPRGTISVTKNLYRVVIVDDYDDDDKKSFKVVARNISQAVGKIERNIEREGGGTTIVSVKLLEKYILPIRKGGKKKW